MKRHIKNTVTFWGIATQIPFPSAFLPGIKNRFRELMLELGRRWKSGKKKTKILIVGLRFPLYASSDGEAAIF